MKRTKYFMSVRVLAIAAFLAALAGSAEGLEHQAAGVSEPDRTRSWYDPKVVDQELLRQAKAAGCEQETVDKMADILSQYRAARYDAISAVMARKLSSTELHDRSRGAIQTRERRLKQLLSPAEFAGLHFHEAYRHAATIARKAEQALCKPILDPQEKNSRAIWTWCCHQTRAALVEQAISAGCDSVRAGRMRHFYADYLAARQATVDGLSDGRIDDEELYRRAFVHGLEVKWLLGQCLTAEEFRALDEVLARRQVMLEREPDADGPLYFLSAERAVVLTKHMLERKEWPRLARYYDLRGTDIDLASLRSGAYFYTDERPKAAHPAGFWRYKHPFAPDFDFHHVEKTREPDVVRVVVSIEIDQGAGAVQRGFQSFRMRNCARGLQFLPEPRTEALDELARSDGVEESAAGETVPQLRILYETSGEIHFHDIRIAGRQLQYEYLPRDRAQELARGLSGSGVCRPQQPYWGDRDLVTATGALSRRDFRELVELILGSGFMDLEPEYAAKSRRGYPRRIAVQLDERRHEVVYAGGPDAPPCPPAFERLEAKLLALAARASQTRVSDVGLTMAAQRCQAPLLEEAQRELAALERQLSIKRTCLSRLEDAIAQGQYGERLIRAMKRLWKKYREEIASLESRIRLLKEEIGRLTRSSLGSRRDQRRSPGHSNLTTWEHAPSE